MPVKNDITILRSIFSFPNNAVSQNDFFFVYAYHLSPPAATFHNALLYAAFQKIVEIGAIVEVSYVIDCHLSGKQLKHSVQSIAYFPLCNFTAGAIKNKIERASVIIGVHGPAVPQVIYKLSDIKRELYESCFI